MTGSQKIKCRATSKRSGKPCEKWAVKGALVCSMHGAGGDASIPQTGAHKAVERQESAEAELRRRLWEMREPALDAVKRVLEDPQAKATDVLKAADTILNRFVPTKAETKIVVDSEERDLDDEIAKAMGIDEDDTQTG